MQASVIGYPRIGKYRELKFWTEDYFHGKISEHQLKENAKKLRSEQWEVQSGYGIDLIPSNDFSFYDGMLDTAVLLGAIPRRYRDLHLNELDTYFAMARGYQGGNGDVKALSMRKWFNTNYHYIVPELDDQIEIRLSGNKPFDEFLEAKEQGIQTKPVVIGPFTFLKLAKYKGKKQLHDYVDVTVRAYVQLIRQLGDLGADWLQLDEPILVTDLTHADITLFTQIYTALLEQKGELKILLQTYFGDIRDCYTDVTALALDGIGLDFVEGRESFSLVQRYGFPKDKLLFAGVVNGKNIWRNDYGKTLQTLRDLQKSALQIVISTSCSLLHVPYTVQSEEQLDESIRSAFAFAEEKLEELSELKALVDDNASERSPKIITNAQVQGTARHKSEPSVQQRIDGLTDADFTRSPAFAERAALQKAALQLPLLPTTTIGSFPQTQAVKSNRSKYKKGEITAAQYEENLRSMIKNCISLQEKLGLDVLVHGEFERNDMVEYFGEKLSGFLFTKQAWVQSYGTRCVKPPIIWGDVKRSSPISVEISQYAQSLTDKPVKGMLTGPVTILNWSFPREDISSKEMALQIALAIRDEVLDLEAAGLRIIQVDEAALKEKLPLRKSDWHTEYLDWAIPAFRLVHSGVKASTQIHTHMCYSEFQEILGDIDAMDADVISFEASRSNLSIVDAIIQSGFKTAVGPGVYDIHSPRIPAKEEMAASIQSMLQKISPEKLWLNPDCGLKTRGEAETLASLKHLVEAASQVRGQL
ncbi:5-methyltetrahydropteroyltriglutamate--homocysteine S-methyltransferase [Paenibacillus puldeungensis]|uniref:5-methyltetrahydropteroyltriglutamate--homocysteine methyltransferase n=1 Tax=Paenibacillus puldeungensis TaxID=696536 RepID=A0ABW3RU54_9BACL